jgi:hypothetical protein
MAETDQVPSDIAEAVVSPEGIVSMVVREEAIEGTEVTLVEREKEKGRGRKR